MIRKQRDQVPKEPVTHRYAPSTSSSVQMCHVNGSVSATKRAPFAASAPPRLMYLPVERERKFQPSPDQSRVHRIKRRSVSVAEQRVWSRDSSWNLL